MRIDAHQHFWKIGRYDYPWMGPPLKAICRDFGPDDLEPLLARHSIERTILVQTISSLDETKWFLELAARHPFIAGVVGWVDLKDPAVGETVQELRQRPGLVGIRHQVHDEPDAGWLLEPEVRRGLRELAKRRIPFDLLIRPEHLAPALEVAREFPELRLVVDHIAKPRILQKGWDDWADGLAALGRCPNVWCKLSGMITEADWERWQPADLGRYIEHALVVFGPDRLLFGSDWPVCLLAGSYDRVLEALVANLGALDSGDQAKIFGQNAARCYGLAGECSK